jgi:hypothetical protein
VFRRPIVVAPAPAPPPRRYGRRLIRLTLRWSVRLAVLAVLVTGALLAAALVWSLPAPSAEARSAGVNALWVERAWVAEPHSDEEHGRLSARLQQSQISDVLVVVGPLDGQGTAPPGRTPRAGAFADAVHRGAPGTRVLAALGQRLPSAGGPLRLYDRGVREAIVAAARDYLDLGYDGIHYDIGPVRPGDRDLLDLLDRTRELTAGRGAVVSVALEQLQAHPAVASLVMPVVRSYAEPDAVYLSAVADRVDQLVIMAYDSGLPTRSSFAAYVAWQTERTARIVSDRVTLFMGVPTTDGEPRDHQRRAETPGAALHGLRRGIDALGGPAVTGRPIGAALHAGWTTSEEDWRTWLDEWVTPGDD